MPITFTPGLTMTPGVTVAASSVSNYSVQFDGSNYLTTPYSSAYSVSTNAFTITNNGTATVSSTNPFP